MDSTKTLSKKDIADFQKVIYSYYHQKKRSFPWRETDNPYHILVSEFMLQQTQTDRVIPMYITFLERFPDISSLATASRKVILLHWKGLGYYRRAIYLQSTARVIHEKFHGTIPDEPAILEELPGIGPYTAAAVVTFSYNKPLIFVETNIRSVFIHYFMKERKDVPDSDLVSLVEQTLDRKNPKEWYHALMDHGVMIKKKHGNPNKQSRRHTTQKSFEGSRRQKRGRILEELLHYPSLSYNELALSLNEGNDELNAILNDLENEGFITKNNRNMYSILDS